VQVGPPRELYTRPRTRFVADFLGEANFIEAKVARVEGGVAELATAAGTVRAELAPGRTLSPGASVTCTIRPEAWRLVPRGGGGGGVMPLDAVIRESVYLGEVVQHSIELAGGQRALVTEMHPKVMPAPGSAVRVIADSADVIVLES
jgi:ABC-type Fe3+/spermidine/putrescine transport system ATPase subunit